MKVDMSSEAVAERLRRASPPDLSPARRMHHKLDMSERGVTARLRQVSELHALARWLMAARPSHPPPDASA